MLTPNILQRGVALIVMMVILVMGTLTFLISSLDLTVLRTTRDRLTSDNLGRVKETLIGDTVSQPSLLATGYLRLPDLGFKIGQVPYEGSSAPNFSGNSMDLSVIGKVPWKSLGIPPPLDGQGECIWYVLSGRFKNVPQSNTPLNWDTLGQIDIIDANGNTLASNVAALLIAPGPPLDGQNRALADPAYIQCKGNYDARNYLDSYNSSDAVLGEVNYFAGSTNSRLAPNTNNKRFVLAGTAHYNDRLLAVTTDDIFRLVSRRSDFATQISSLMNDPYFQAAVPTPNNKGTGNLNCNGLNPANQAFCSNWKEMLLLTQLPTPAPIVIDGTTTATCTRVLIFGGHKSANQTRATPVDKTNPANYLEDANLSTFALPTAASNHFSGTSTFNANNPGADLLKCLP